MEGKGSFFILLVIIAILTLTLAVTMGYLFIVGGPSQSKVVTVEAQATKRPAEKELEKLVLFTDGIFNLRSEDSSKVPVIMITAEITYYKNIKGYSGKVNEKINFDLPKIKELVGTYFQKLTLDEVKNPEAKEKANKELCNQINEYLSSTEKEKRDFIYEIAFEKWFYQ